MADVTQEESMAMDTPSLDITDLPIEMLDKIMSYLPLPALKYMRRVTPTWNNLVSSYILRHDLCAIRLRWDKDVSQYFQDKTVQNRQFALPSSIKNWSNQPLNDLTDLLHTSLNEVALPASHFQFTGGNLGSLDSQIFFGQVGPQIKTLFVKFERGGTDRVTFYNILHEKLPNLESLRVFNIRHLRMKDEENKEPEVDDQGHPKFVAPPPPPFLLPNLKSLTLGYNDQINNNDRCIAELFSMAPNLRYYDGPSWSYDIQNFEIFTALSKTHTVKTFTFEPRSDNLEFYAKFAQAPNFHLKMLNIFPRQNRMRTTSLQEETTQALSQILRASRETLISLSIQSPLIFLRDLDWPELSSVTLLSLNFRIYFTGFSPNSLDNSSFQKWLNVHKIFPVLTTIHFDGFSLWTDWQKSLSTNFFPFMPTALPTVRRLCLQRNVPNCWLAEFPRMFPNLQFLSWEEIKDFPEIAKFLWNFSSVRELELHLIVGEGARENWYPGLDAAFTGLSQEDCREIINGGEGPIDNSTRVSSSIVKMSMLKDLKISLRDIDDEPKELYQILHGQLTGQMAFGLMRDLSVRIEVVAQTESAERIQESLVSMAPFALIQRRTVERNMHSVSSY